MALDLKHELNAEQYAAATTLNGPLLVIAGAGSGKTRMLTYRITHMLKEGIKEQSILALTFTNKAAAEMGQRIRELTGTPLPNLTTSTFHSFGVRILKQYIHHLGWKNSFTIYDSNDRMALIKEVILNLDYVVESFDLWELSTLFSDIKTGRKVFGPNASLKMKELYSEYEKHLKAYNAVDFDDLITKPLDLFASHPHVLQQLQSRYTHILVDEFQDTSLAQYRIVQQLASQSRNLCVVGDDDQSIYSWRGANYENLVMFERDFPERVEIKLERNYRCTPTILEAANALITNNRQRKEKRLWTDGEQGSSIKLIHPENDQDEASVIADQIMLTHRREDRPFTDFAILVRTNSLLDTLETKLTERSIPTKVTGGRSFFDRKEIRDIISYLRVVANQNDDINLLRVINTPRRGIGRTTLERMRSVAEDHRCSLFNAAQIMGRSTDGQIMGRSTDGQIREGIRLAIQRFTTLIDDLHYDLFSSGKPKHVALRHLVKTIDYRSHIEAEHPDNEAAVAYTMKSIDILCDMLARFERENLSSSIFDFLNNLSLAGKEGEKAEDEGRVALMTIHAAKGLEWHTVFVAGVEDHYIPHARALEDNPANIDEERRLFYVAITRARRNLVLSSCEHRKRGHAQVPSLPSRFLEEIPKNLFDEEDPTQQLSSDEVVDKLRLLRERLEQKIG